VSEGLRKRAFLFDFKGLFVLECAVTRSCFYHDVYYEI
jgi:hypothetical protein